jgi:PGM1 C-terminal domain
MSRSPIPWGLTPSEELESFSRLKSHLAALWADVFPKDDEPYTSVIVPSVSVAPEALRRRPSALFYEETLLFLLIRLRNPRARVVYVTSEPIPAPVMEYYLQFLAGIPVSHAVARLTLLSAYDRSPRPLTEKILERPRLVDRIRAAIPDLSRAYLTVFRATSLERRLAVLLGIPLNAADPGMDSLCTKSGSRRALRDAGLEVPDGAEGLRDEHDLLEALVGLRRRHPRLRRALIKLNGSPWNEGTAVFSYPPDPAQDSLRRALSRVEFAEDSQTPEVHLEAFRRVGGVVEEFVEGVLHAASGQVRINPRAQVIPTSTHDEIRGGRLALSCGGCRFPADDRWRVAVQNASLRVGERLAAEGLVSRLSVEFLVLPGPTGVRLLGTEINLGVGGATHPLLAVRFLSGGALDPTSGLFLAPSGRPKFYRATDELASPAYRGLSPLDLVDILTANQLNYSPRTESGALCYMLGGISELGRVGLVAIGGSREEAEDVFLRTVATLDRESAPRS